MVTANEINTSFIINTICGGDADKALKIAREFPRVQITLTPKSIERFLILEYIEIGLSDEEIVELLSTDEVIVRVDRVKRLRSINDAETF